MSASRRRSPARSRPDRSKLSPDFSSWRRGALVDGAMRIVKLGAALFVVTNALGCYLTGSLTDFNTSGIQKAAFDMSCDKEKLTVTELGPGSMGVRGCGKQARYESVTGVGWVLNSGEDAKK
jgi:hypothetical protein